MKILHINSYYSVSPFYKNLYDEQIKLNHDIDVYVPVSKTHIQQNKNMGLYTKVKQVFYEKERYIFHLKHIKILNDIEKEYNVENYEIFHAHSLFSNGYIAYKLSRKYGIPYIVAIRNTDVNLFFKKMFHLRKLGIKIINNASKVIFISKTYQKEVINSYIPYGMKDNVKIKSEVITNGIDNFWLKNTQRKKIKKIGNIINLLYVGDVNDNKNTKTTLKVCELLMKNGYDVNYKIVGNLKNKKYLSLFKKHSFVDYDRFTSKENLVAYYREADIFIMPSINETFGLVYAEAMSQGLPVIYTRNQGFDGQYAEGVVGYSVSPYDIVDIYNKIILIKNNYNSISDNCVKYSKNYSWVYLNNKYLDIYSDVIKTKRD